MILVCSFAYVELIHCKHAWQRFCVHGKPENEVKHMYEIRAWISLEDPKNESTDRFFDNNIVLLLIKNIQETGLRPKPIQVTALIVAAAGNTASVSADCSPLPVHHRNHRGLSPPEKERPTRVEIAPESQGPSVPHVNAWKT
jgi:hypothetical protein